MDFEYRNAVWGFEWEEEKFVFFESIKGLSIEVPRSFKQEKIEPLVKELIGIICKK